jgi:hypothetical protein
LVVARLAFTNAEVPGPATCVHVPVPVVGTLPASVAVNPHTVASGPAFEVVGTPDAVADATVATLLELTHSDEEDDTVAVNPPNVVAVMVPTIVIVAEVLELRVPTVQVGAVYVPVVGVMVVGEKPAGVGIFTETPDALLQDVAELFITTV